MGDSLEREILASLLSKRSNKELAEALRISVRTVHAHLANVYKKLGVHNRKEAVWHVLGGPGNPAHSKANNPTRR